MRSLSSQKIRRSLAAIAIASSALASAVSADINMAGEWNVQAFGSGTTYQIVQNGSSLGALSNHNLYYWQGSIDVATGVYTLTASLDTVWLTRFCGTLNATVTADGNSFSGTFSSAPYVCSPQSCVCGEPEVVPVIGSRSDSPFCGNGTVESDEACDDGNAGGGDCCSSTCRFEAAGSACAADTSPCTADVCDAAGMCLPGLLRTCPLASRQATITVKGNGAQTRVRATWKDASGATVTFGQPTSYTTLRLCVFSGSTLVLDAAAPAGACGTLPCWSEIAQGYKYRGPSGAPDRLTRIALRHLGNDRSLLDVKWRGSTLALLAAPTPPLHAQILASDFAGTRCWDVE